MIWSLWGLFVVVVFFVFLVCYLKTSQATWFCILCSKAICSEVIPAGSLSAYAQLPSQTCIQLHGILVTFVFISLCFQKHHKEGFTSLERFILFVTN